MLELVTNNKSELNGHSIVIRYLDRDVKKVTAKIETLQQPYVYLPTSSKKKRRKRR